MYRKLRFKILVLSLMLFIPLVLGTTNGYAYSPPPPGAQIKGPVVTGLLTLSGDPGAFNAVGSLDGSCQGTPVIIDILVPAGTDITLLPESIILDIVFSAHSECMTQGEYKVEHIHGYEVTETIGGLTSEIQVSIIALLID